MFPCCLYKIVTFQLTGFGAFIKYIFVGFFSLSCTVSEGDIAALFSSQSEPSK